jgi:hypothetical protein
MAGAYVALLVSTFSVFVRMSGFETSYLEDT